MSQDLRNELHELTRAFRVWAEFTEDAGTYGLPSGGPRGELRGEPHSPALVSPPAALASPTPVAVVSPAPHHVPVMERPPVERPVMERPVMERPPVERPVMERPVSREREDLGPSSPRGLTAVTSTATHDDERSPQERRVRLVTIAEQVASCRACELHRGRNHTVFARGDEGAELVFVGEGPGADEDLQGLPFVGKAGQLLDKMIEAMGYRPAEVYIANVVKCRPPDNRKPEPAEMAACLPYLSEQLELVAPRAIVALGATATEGLLGMTGITRLRGTWRLWRGRIPVMPTFHPSYLLRNPAAKREVWEDLKKVLERLGRTPPAPRGRTSG